MFLLQIYVEKDLITVFIAHRGFKRNVSLIRGLNELLGIVQFSLVLHEVWEDYLTQLAFDLLQAIAGTIVSNCGFYHNFAFQPGL